MRSGLGGCFEGVSEVSIVTPEGGVALVVVSGHGVDGGVGGCGCWWGGWIVEMVLVE